ncbi:MAG TPA: hypothetical protein VFX21_11935, partial [Acidimicrobiia bacterium]|nr:hypothetical protein [Acidimicrobiia bacterium]
MKRLGLAVLVLALGLAACGGDDDDNATSSPSTEAVSKTGDDADAEHAAEHAAGEHDMEGMDASEHDMADMEDAVDDRGFAKLENGEQHAHSFTQAISKEDRVELARQLVLARETA